MNDLTRQYIETLIKRIAQCSVYDGSKDHAVNLMNRVERLLRLVDASPVEEPRGADLPLDPEPVKEPEQVKQVATVTKPPKPAPKVTAPSVEAAQLSARTRSEQLAYCITELGGGAYLADIRQWMVERELFDSDKQARSIASNALSTYSDKFGNRDGKWYVKPGWYTHVKQPEPFVTDTNGRVKDCPMSPNGAHHWLLDAPDGPESSGKCKYCPAVTDGLKNSIRFSAWDRSLKQPQKAATA